MKILFITPHFPSLLGGEENYVFNTALGFKQKYNSEVVVVTSNPQDKDKVLKIIMA